MATKFNEQICEELCSYYEEGLPQKTCADLCGISRMTLNRWVEKGRNAKSGKYRDFYLRWCKSKAKFIQHHTNKIADNPSWLASQYLLQVTDPETYVVAEKQEMETTVKADATVNADIDVTSDDFMTKELDLMKTLIEDKRND